MSPDPAPFELDADRMRELLGLLSERLRSRGVRASLYLVGGAAMAMEYGRDGLTADIDAVASHRVVFEEARSLARQNGLPEAWLNSSASGWVPPPPNWARRRPTEPGLTVHVAPPDHLLAMKLVASRRKHRSDIRLLIQRCGLVDATAEEFAGLLERVYAGEGLLAQMLGVGDDLDAVRTEALAIGAWAVGFVADLRTA
ncbi:DUF6036 family nucleotidyltransferase [Nocardioides flavescens]|uniref:DUF6036 domain-containing protein n=1 Tax=Nocardioides flavescens TaxID=2691959 RepID=A0A6L7F4A7_9ACTN|nr:DUF6036 family nucleotidyltransferase [Nocardioides flavescens]MXG92077.1 hypothetical protein [Nocardioides flavescens]